MIPATRTVKVGLSVSPRELPNSSCSSCNDSTIEGAPSFAETVFEKTEKLLQTTNKRIK